MKIVYTYSNNVGDIKCISEERNYEKRKKEKAQK